MKTLSNKEAILGLSDLPIISYYVEAWDAEVKLRTLSSSERDRFEKEVFARGDMQKANLDNFRAKLVALCLVDEKGDRIFTDPTDIQKLGKKSAAALDDIFKKAQEICGLTEKDVDDLTKK